MTPAKRKELEEKVITFVETSKLMPMKAVADIMAAFDKYYREEIEQAEKAYFQSVMRSRAKTDPDMTIKEFYERQFEQKHNYKGASSPPQQELKAIS